jgi:hypothetical protein
MMAVGSAVSKSTFWGSKVEFELMLTEEECQAEFWISWDEQCGQGN